MIFVFAKTPDDALAGLAKGIDKLVAENKEKKLAAVVNFVGEPKDDEAKAKIKEFGEKNELKNVALTITSEAKKFKIADDAAVTVMHYRDKKVQFNYAAAQGGLGKEAVAAILGGAQKILEQPAEKTPPDKKEPPAKKTPPAKKAAPDKP